MRRYYVYGLYDPRDGSLIYIGKGCGTRAMYHHCRRPAIRVKEWIETNGRPDYRTIEDNLTEEEAYDLERELIRKYGKLGIDPGGVLINVAIGGAGAPGVPKTPETRKMISENNLKPEVREAWIAAVNP